MIIPDGFAQINAIHTGAGVPTGAEWTLGVGLDTFTGTPNDLAKAFEVWLLASALYVQVSASVTMTAVLVKFGPNATGPSSLEPANQPGTDSSESTPAPSFLIHKNTDDGGRAGRGRFYLPGVPEIDVEIGGALSSGKATAVNTALGILKSEMEADGVIPMVLHGAGSPLSTPSPITSFSCDARIATQRRRLRR